MFDLLNVAGFAIATVWALLLLASQLLYRLSLGLRPLPLPWLTLPPSTFERAKRAASDRRRKIEAVLREYDIIQGPTTEFLEVPPGFPDVPLRRFEQKGASAAFHSAHLRWQLKNEERKLGTLPIFLKGVNNGTEKKKKWIVNGSS